MRLLATVCLLALSFVFPTTSSSSQGKSDKGGDDFYGRKYALVIGNSKYEASPLKNPENDAADLSETLKKTGFKVTTVLNADVDAFRLALANFESSLPDGAAVLLFYAGHGVQYQAQNFLIPIGGINRIKSGNDLFTQAIALNQILEQLSTKRKSISVIILDACRNSPFPALPEVGSGLSRSSGLSQVAKGDEKPKKKKSNSLEGVVVAYSTAPDMTAADGAGRNSPYAKHLKQFLRRPDTSLEAVLKLTRVEVTKETGGRQTPWYETSINGDFYVAGRGRIEFEDLLRLLIPYATGTSDDGFIRQPYTSEKDLPDPIRWNDKAKAAPSFNFETLPAYGDFRLGEVVILVDGEPTHGLKKNPATWQVALLGVRGGWSMAGLTTNTMGFGGPEIKHGFGQAEFMQVEPDCRREDGINGSRVFKVTFEGHIPAWIAESFTCGAANCQADYVLFFDKDERKTFGCG
jgi:hypothetical protein